MGDKGISWLTKVINAILKKRYQMIGGRTLYCLFAKNKGDVQTKLICHTMKLLEGDLGKD